MNTTDILNKTFRNLRATLGQDTYAEFIDAWYESIKDSPSNWIDPAYEIACEQNVSDYEKCLVEMEHYGDPPN